MKSPSTQHWMYWQLSVKGELIGLESHLQMIPMNQSRNLYIIKTWIENQETFSQISNINHTTRWWNFWKEKIGKKSCFQFRATLVYMFINWFETFDSIQVSIETIHTKTYLTNILLIKAIRKYTEPITITITIYIYILWGGHKEADYLVGDY